MYTRKQIKGVLKEWKNYISALNEAKEGGDKPYVVRIFDFDGTVVTYDNQELLDLMKNPYIFSLANPLFIEEYKQKTGGEEGKKTGGVVIPAQTVKLINSADEAYISSKVKSTGFDRKVANAYDSNIKSIIETGRPDDKMAVLFDFIKKNSDENFDIVKFIKEKASQGFDVVKREFNTSPEIKKYLKIADMTQPEDDGKIGTQKLLALQKQRIPQIIKDNGLNIPEENIVVTPALALTKDVPIEGGQGAITTQAERGTSGKIMDVYGIAKRVIGSLPEGTKVKFELFDNSESNLGEMIDGVTRAMPDYVELPSSDQLSTVEDCIEYLKQNTRFSETYEIVAMLAKATASSISYENMEGRVSKSKGSPTSTTRVFQGLKGAFQTLVLRMTSTTGGRRSNAVVTTFEQLFKSPDYNIGEHLKKLYDNLGKAGIKTTGLEEEYSNREKLHNLIGDIKDFVAKFPRLKQEFDTKLASLTGGVVDEPAAVEPAAAEKPKRGRPAKPKAVAVQDDEIDAAEEADENYFRELFANPTKKNNFLDSLEYMDDDHPTKIAYDKWLEKNKSMRESLVRPQKRLLREFKLVLKTKR